MSNIIKFEIDSKIFYKDLEYIIKGYPSFDEILLKRDIAPFNEKIVKVHELIIDPKNIKENGKTLVGLEQKDFDKANERYEIIKSLVDKKDRTASDVLKIAKKYKKGIATIYRWLNTYEQYKSISSLASKREFCGAKGKSRLNDNIDTIINSVIEEYYLHKQKYPLQMIYDEIVYKCKHSNLKAPTKNTIRNRINSLHPKIIAKNRHAVRVNESRGMSGSFPEVKMPLDIIQIDHTKVDVILVDEETRKPIGRPYITVAIDVYSRMIFGFYISLEAPSYFSVGQCLLNAILPKDDFMKKYEIKGEWPVYGLPKKVHMDNGKDFRSISLQNFCKEYRIEDIYRPVARPEFGGAIERVIGTCMKKVHTLPGSTFSNIFEKGTYDSNGNAVMTIDKLEKWYLDFVINVYHKTEHTSLGMTPEEKFYQGLYGVGEDKAIPFLPIVPADTLKLRMALLPAINRTVQKNGITIDYITYFSETLRKYIIPTQYKKLRPDLENSVVCRRDPRDISKLYVYDEDIKDYITVPYADIRRPKMNLSELRSAIAEARAKIKGRELEPHDIFEAHERLHSYVAQAKQEKKSVRRKDSSKKHQEKTLQNDKERIDYKENQPSYISATSKDEEDDSDYEIYPIG
ncbi:Mu transposase C-terminal domain-containing protein [Aliarcobacter butzleri]|uniref:Mu transposase C-terminal domain-containing protein n=1 Tax=Aliarcobacter butzleri TaxID=28197 RepID=UPI00214CF44E|nr:Mu transposase C-terminal domain-containing protein [Aliarcobacter butzleri]MCP3650213.1 DDE-type integrase/transposase/recombinase [Arcobacter sp. DNRA7]MCR1816386.1 DDE-type integrase/transposase/recombinase [Aliarcobacter butzleri]